jgi:hypothetical protein
MIEAAIERLVEEVELKGMNPTSLSLGIWTEQLDGVL